MQQSSDTDNDGAFGTVPTSEKAANSIINLAINNQKKESGTVKSRATWRNYCFVTYAIEKEEHEPRRSRPPPARPTAGHAPSGINSDVHRLMGRILLERMAPQLGRQVLSAPIQRDNAEGYHNIGTK